MFSGFLGKKCEYCRNSVPKEMVVEGEVKVLGYVGTQKKNFCSHEHLKQYKSEVDEHLKNQKTSGGSCCG